MSSNFNFEGVLRSKFFASFYESADSAKGGLHILPCYKVQLLNVHVEQTAFLTLKTQVIRDTMLKKLVHSTVISLVFQFFIDWVFEYN